MDKHELEIISILRELEIPAHVKGYAFIKSAIKYLRENPNSLYHLTTELYPEDGLLHGADIESCHVERGMRHEIRQSRANKETWIKIFGQPGKEGRMSTGEFLASLAEVIRVRMAGEEG